MHLKFMFGFLQIQCWILTVQIQKPLVFLNTEFRWNASTSGPLYRTFVNTNLQLKASKLILTGVLVKSDPVCYRRNAFVVNFRYLSFSISQKEKSIQCVILYLITSAFFIYVCQNFRHLNSATLMFIKFLSLTFNKSGRGVRATAIYRNFLAQK